MCERTSSKAHANTVSYLNRSAWENISVQGKKSAEAGRWEEAAGETSGTRPWTWGQVCGSSRELGGSYLVVFSIFSLEDRKNIWPLFCFLIYLFLTKNILFLFSYREMQFPKKKKKERFKEIFPLQKLYSGACEVRTHSNNSSVQSPLVGQQSQTEVKLSWPQAQNH